MKSGIISSLILLFALLSCVDGIYPYLGKPLSDPVVAIPEVKSFSRENTMVVSWEEDSCADEYILFRKEDSEFATDEIIYRGTNLEYTDTDGSSEERYLYSLSKVRGTREFGPSDTVFGLFSETIEDFFEPNDTKEEAVWLEYDLEANSHYYQDRTGNILGDEDWYYVKVPPRRVANIILDQNGLDVGDTFFYFSQEGEVPFRISNNSDIPIQNYSYNTKKFYFKIYPIPAEFLNDITQPGGSVVGYTLSLHLITTL